MKVLKIKEIYKSDNFFYLFLFWLLAIEIPKTHVIFANSLQF
jgi:hypothetical protein